MDNNNDIKDFSFQDIVENIDNENLPNDFLCFENLTEQLKDFDDFCHTRYPMRFSCVLVTLCINGYLKFKIGPDSIECAENHFAVIMPDKIFQLVEVSPDFKGVIVSLEKKFFDIQKHGKEALSLSHYFTRNTCFYLPEEFCKEFLTIYYLIKDKLKDKNNIYQKEIVQSYCYVLFCDVCNVLNYNEKKDNNTRQSDIVLKFYNLVEQYYKKERSIIFYADKLCITPIYLSSVIHSASGKFAGEWIDDYVVMEAQMLLHTTNMTVTQISDYLNFTTSSHFGRFFKKHVGITPKKYRDE